MNLANHNNDTLAAGLKSLFERLENLEAAFVKVPLVGEYAAKALAATKAVDGVVDGVDEGVEAVEEIVAPKPVAAPKAPKAVAAPTAAQKIAAIANA